MTVSVLLVTFDQVGDADGTRRGISDRDCSCTSLPVSSLDESTSDDSTSFTLSCNSFFIFTSARLMPVCLRPPSSSLLLPAAAAHLSFHSCS